MSGYIPTAQLAIQAAAEREGALARLFALGADGRMLEALGTLVAAGMTPTEVETIAQIYVRGGFSGAAGRRWLGLLQR
ncbi:hypothetical protein Agsp01_11780 [Agromyces sp. NBRC 114283]|nr:hypothetical protein Agsp01_11780 [Agromyces sp. NBRC 114283]